MENSQEKNTRKIQGDRRVNDLALRTLSVNEAIADALRPFATKLIARRIKTSERTIEQWRQAKTGPQAKHFVALLKDPDLRPAVLSAIGLEDLATRAEIVSLNRRIEALKAAEAQHREEADDIRQSLEGGSARVAVAGGKVQHRGDEAAEGGGVVPRSSDRS